MTNTTLSQGKGTYWKMICTQCLNQHPISSLVVVQNIYFTKKTTLSNRRLTILIAKHRTIITKYYDSCWWLQNFLVFYNADWKIISASSCKNSHLLGISTSKSCHNSKTICNRHIIQLRAVGFKYLQWLQLIYPDKVTK